MSANPLLTRTVPTPAKHTFGYNGVDKRVSYTTPLQKQTTYTNGRVTAITTSYDGESNAKTLSFLGHTVSYARDALGLPSQIADIRFSYDANGIRTETLYPNTTKEQNTFDAVYNIKKIQTADQTLNYTQDKTGLITSKNSTNYTYDAIGRLTQAGSDSFNYDVAGNNLNDNAIYNILNNRLQASDLYAITYDSMGNIASKYNKLTKTKSLYTFNARNQLIQYEQQDENNQTVKTLEFAYDAFGRRISKTEDGAEQKYLYDGDDIIAILDSNNQVIATITHDESIDTPLSITNQNGTFYYHRDHQGSIVALTDSSGAVVESFTYDNHYGTIVDHTKTIETNNPYAYTGRELDTDELYYYRARYYDPSLQRFITEDPIKFNGEDFNFYRYVGNSPVTFYDPIGLTTLGIKGCLVNFGNPIWIKTEDYGSGWSSSTVSAVDGFWWNGEWYKVSDFGTCYIFDEFDYPICIDLLSVLPGRTGPQGKCHSDWGCGPE